MSIQFAHVAFRYRGKRAAVFDDLSVTIGREPTLLLGRNGSGKSTLLKLAAGLEKPTSGDILARGRVTYLPQNFVTVPGLSVSSYVSYLAWIAGRRRTLAYREAPRWLAAVGMEGFAEASNKELSGGQQSRVALAYALNSGARTILMDEPGAALDPISKADLHKLYKVVVDSGKSLVVSSHDPTDLDGPFRRIIIVDSGRILFDGSGANVLHGDHQSPLVQNCAQVMSNRRRVLDA